MDNDRTGGNAFHTQEEGVPAQPTDQRLPQGFSADDAEMGMEALLAENDYAFRSVRRGETVEGTVVRVDPDEILVDIGLKSEGIIPQREFLSETLEAEPLHVGDSTLVYVMQPEGADGHAVLSLRRAQLERSWREIEELYNRGAIIEAPVVDFNKGGLIVDVKGVRGFVPVSQVLDLRNVSRQEGENEEVASTLQAMNGRRLSLKIIEINRSRNRLILSERAAVQEQRTQRKDELIDQLEPGQVRHGVVSNLTNFGAFVDLGGADGLVHVSELSYNRVNHPSEILRVGQQVDVMVLNVDRDTKKIALSLKRAMPDPWTTVETTYHVGQVVPATITKLAKFGAFAKVQDGLEGLIHLSELTDLAVQDPAQVVQEGQDVNVKIIHINTQRRRLGLSVRQAEARSDATPYAAPDASAFGDDMDYGSYAAPSPTASGSTGGFSTYEDDTPGAFAQAYAAAEEQTGNSSPEPAPESEQPTGEQPSSAAEFEPVDSSHVDNEPVAAAPEEAPPAAEEDTPADDGDGAEGITTAVPQGSASE